MPKKNKKDTTVAGQLGADPTLPRVPLILGGKKRWLAYDFNALSVLEELTGSNPLRTVVMVDSPIRIRVMLWTALLRDEPELKLGEVGRWINRQNSEGVVACILQAWGESTTRETPLPEKKTPGEDEAQAKTTA